MLPSVVVPGGTCCPVIQFVCWFVVSYAHSGGCVAQEGSQRFGSVHTQIKLGALANYLPAYTTALKRSGFTLHYIDAFAGTGKCTIRAGVRERTIPGSAWLALECQPPFDKYFFIEKSRAKVHELEQLVAYFKGRDVIIRHEDANVALPAYLAALTGGDRVTINLDPFGMDVDWATLERIADSKKADVWYLFSLSGLYRQATRDAADVDESKAAALTRVLGPNDWRAALYEDSRQGSLFGADTQKRSADPYRMAEWVTGCLKDAFPGVAGPHILHMRTSDGKQGPPIFALYFLVSNPAPKAIQLALRIANGVFKRLP